MAIADVMSRLLWERRGATMIEYGLILAVAAIIILAAAGILGSATIDNFNGLDAKIKEAQPDGTTP